MGNGRGRRLDYEDERARENMERIESLLFCMSRCDGECAGKMNSYSARADTHVKAFQSAVKYQYYYSLDIMLTSMAVSPCLKNTVEPML